MKRRMVLSACALVIGVGLATGAWATGVLEVNWWSIDGGGAISNGGTYSVRGTIGQTDPGVLTGGNFTLVGGFHSGDQPRYQVMLPLTRR